MVKQTIHEADVISDVRETLGGNYFPGESPRRQKLPSSVLNLLFLGLSFFLSSLLLLCFYFYFIVLNIFAILHSTLVETMYTRRHF